MRADDQQRVKASAFAKRNAVAFRVKPRAAQAVLSKLFRQVFRALSFAERRRGDGTDARVLVRYLRRTLLKELKRAQHARRAEQLSYDVFGRERDGRNHK
jgi:hypothetical protein